MKIKKILEIVEANEICSCNICTKRHTEVEKMYEVRLGVNNHCNVNFMCPECLNEFADILWQSLESEGN